MACPAVQSDPMSFRVTVDLGGNRYFTCEADLLCVSAGGAEQYIRDFRQARAVYLADLAAKRSAKAAALVDSGFWMEAAL